MTEVIGTWLEGEAAQAVLSALEARGASAYFVGGCVRNALLDLPVKDLDIATSARPETIIEIARALGFKPIPTGIEHGTITIVGAGSVLEVTTFRKDVETDGRHAVIAFSDSLAEDAARRDFRMNALYADRNGKLTDPTGGLADIVARKICFVGVAHERIREDYLRSVRLFRFAAQLGFGAEGIDPVAAKAAGRLSYGLHHVSVERITAEMLKLLGAEQPIAVLQVMQDTGVLARIVSGASLPVLQAFLAFGGEAVAVTRLAALMVSAPNVQLRLSKKERRLFETLQRFAWSAQSGAELAYREGFLTAQAGVRLRAALCGDTPDLVGLVEAAEACFPLAARDLPTLKGRALGEELKRAERAWIASGFQLTKAELLDKK